jgi:hypothetical protein
MVAAHLLDLVRVNTVTTGTGTITLGTAVAGHLTPAQAGAVDGDTLRYVIVDGANTELGTGVYSASANTLTRGMYLSTTNALLNLSGSAQVLLTLAAEDLTSVQLSDFQPGMLNDGMAAVWSTALSKWVPGAVGAQYLGTRPQIVQQVSYSGAPSTSWTLTFTSPPTAGNTILIVFTPLNDAITVPSGFTTVASVSSYAGTIGASVVSKISVGTADQTLTASIGSGFGTDMTIAAFEISGVGAVNTLSGTSSVAAQAVATHSGGQYSETTAYAISSTAAPTQNIGNSLFLSIGSTVGNGFVTSFDWTTLVSSNPANGYPFWVLSSPTWVQPQGAMGGTAPYWTLLNLQIVGVPLKLATNLADVAISAPTNGQALVWNASAGAWENTTLSASTGATYGGADTLVGPASDVAVNGWTGGGSTRTEVTLAKVALTGNYLDLANQPTQALHALTDVNVAEGAGIDGYYLKWSNSTSKWVAAAAASVALSTLPDVSITSPSNGQVLTYSTSLSKWVNAASSSGGGGGGGGGVLLDKDRFAPPYVSDFPTILATNSTNPNTYWGTSIGLVIGSGVNFTSADQVRGIVKPLPSGNWTVTARFRSNHRGLGYETLGLILRDSTSGKIIQFGHDSTYMDIIWWNSQTSYNTAVWASQNYTAGLPEWFRIAYDGTNLNYYLSVDGTYWTLLYSESITAFTPSLNQVGFGLHVNHNSGYWNAATSGDDVILHVFYYNDDTLPASSRTIGGSSAVPAITQFQGMSALTCKFGANVGSATITQGAAGVVVTLPGTSSILMDRIDLSSYPATPVTFISGAEYAQINATVNIYVYIRDAAGHAIFMGVSSTTLLAMHINYTSTSTSWVSTPYSVSAIKVPRYLGIEDDGTNFSFLVGDDPTAMSILYSESRTAFIGTPVAVGLMFQSAGTGSNTTTVFNVNYMSP